MKKIILILAIFASFVSLGMASTPNLSKCKKQTFIVTGYYSPLAGQSFYYKGSLEADKKLNGNGVRGASGKAVFNGMLAAPKTYEFGTKIYFPGYGLGQVQDRGGAIVIAGDRNNEYDRIDIWLGSGEEGLKRALSFGKRQLNGYVCEDGEVGFNMNKFPIYNNLFKDVFWNVTMGIGKTDNNVRTLQTHLKDLGYLTNKEITGYFGNKTESALCQFQVDVGLLRHKDKLCGYYGPNTGSYMKMAIKGTNIDDIKTLVSNKNTSGNVVLASVKLTPKAPVQKEKSMKIQVTLNEGDISYEVRLLQTYLKTIGYLTEKEITGIFGPKTKSALCKFQVDNGLLKPLDKLCGSFGKKSGEILQLALDGNLQPKSQEPLVSDDSKQSIAKDTNIQIDNLNLSLGASGDQIKDLQISLQNMGYLTDNEVIWTFGPKTEQALCEFQVKIGLLQPGDSLCGTYGKKTGQVIKLINMGVAQQQLKSYLESGKKLDDNLEYKNLLNINLTLANQENQDLPNNETNKQIKAISLSRGFKKGESGKDVELLQKHLANMGFYDGKLNGIFDSNTSAAVYKFQIKYEILDSNADSGVKGYFGPKTRQIFNKVANQVALDPQTNNS